MMKQALVNFGKLHPGLVGTDMQEGLWNQASLSIRVLLSHFRKCAQHPEAWATAKRKLKDANLEGVEAVLKKIPMVDDEGEEGAEQNTRQPPVRARVDWMGLQQRAPIVGFWQVLRVDRELGCYNREILSPVVF